MIHENKSRPQNKLHSTNEGFMGFMELPVTVTLLRATKKLETKWGVVYAKIDAQGSLLTI